MTNLPPGLLMIIAAALLPFVPHMARQIVMLGAIALSAYGLVLGFGTHLVWDVIGFELVLYRADSLSFPFAVIFHIAAALNVIYSWHDKHWSQHCAALSYAVRQSRRFMLVISSLYLFGGKQRLSHRCS